MDGEVANLLRSCGLVNDTYVRNKSATVAVMEFGKRHDTTDTTDFCPRQLVTDLSFMLRTCFGLATGKLV